MRKLPFMSVVVISYNGAATLGATLDSLLGQTYPKKKYEVIVVNDGSADETEKVAKSYPTIRYVGLAKNRGISGARNAGLWAAKGQVYVAFDDDCVAKPTWLAELAIGYASGNPLGVGGQIEELHASRGILQQYISISDSDIGARVADKRLPTRNPFKRFWRYIAGRMVMTGTQVSAQKVRVTELYGANGSYPVDVLKSVGGWNETMSGIEDRDLSYRLREAFPRRPFYLMPRAVIAHDRGQTLRQYLARPYRRGVVNLAFHRKNHIAPPLFPFPALFLAAVCAALLVSPFLVAPALFLVPLVLYPWWTYRALRAGKPSMLLFPYIQLAEETMTVTGLARGYGRLWRSILVQARFGFLHLFVALASVVAWAALVRYGSLSPLRIALSTLFLCLVPGYFAWLGIAKENRPRKPSLRVLAYTVGLSLLLLSATGLVLNEAYDLTGATRPLTTAHLVYAVGSVTSLLALWAFLRSPRRFRLFVRPMPTDPSRLASGILAGLIGLVLPFLAAAGAVTLNNGGSNGLALVVLGACAALLLLMAFCWRQLNAYYAWFLYAICLSILLGTSLRGWNITGHDVMQEYQVFQLTLTHAAWHMRYYQDAYMACLSITILPTLFQQLTGIAAPYVFKLTFQVVAALLAPVLYSTLLGFVARRKAMLATFIFMAFPTFLTDIMMLNRQEIAILFFALSLLVGLDIQLPARRRSLLVFMFLVGTVLSHYSTSYVAIGALALALFMAVVWRVFIPFVMRRNTHMHFKRLTSIYHPPVVVAALFVLVAWGSFATQTSNNISQTLRTVTADLVSVAEGKGLPHALPAPSSVPHYVSAQTQSRTLPSTDYYLPTVVNRYPLQAAEAPTSPPARWVAEAGVSSSTLTKAYTLARSAYAASVVVLIVFGMVLLVVLRRLRRQLPVQYFFIGAAMLILIATQVILPAAAINYGLTRLIQQGLLVLALPMLLAALWCLRFLRIPPNSAEKLAALGFVAFFLVLSGFLPAITGGFNPALPLSNSGFYYEAYYTHQQDIDAARWLEYHTPLGSRVYSDEFMRRKLITYGGIFAQPTLVPGAIPVDSYVLLGYGNVTSQRVAAYDGSNLIYYRLPSSFLDATKNIVYSSTDVTIYK